MAIPPLIITASRGTYPTHIRVGYTETFASTYRIHRSLSLSGPYSHVGNSTSLFWDDNSVTPGVIYYYKVSSDTIGGPFSIHQGEGWAGVIPPPEKPVNVNATDGTIAGAVDIIWDPSLGATGYRVFRRVAVDPAADTDTLTSSETSTSFTDSTGVADVIYSYWIMAFNASGVNSPLSNLDNGFAAAVVSFNCLTVSTDTIGGSWTGHPFCPGVDKTSTSDPVACVGDVEENTFVSIIATPDTNYVVSKWVVVSDSGTVILSLSGNPSENETATFTYLNSYGDVTIVVSFASDPCLVTIATGDANGCIRNIYTTATSQTNSQQNIIFIINKTIYRGYSIYKPS